MKELNLLALILIVIVNLISSCKRDEPDQLDLVIEHYSKNPDDSLKLRAAQFIINNLDGLQTLDSGSVASNQIYFDTLDSVYRSSGKITGWPLAELAKHLDRLNQTRRLKPALPSVKYLSEKNTIKAEFLINNIDLAFTAWQSMPWSKSIKFDDFCEYILPYRVTDTYSTTARKKFYERYKSIKDSVKGSVDPFKAAEFVLKDIHQNFSENINVLLRYPYLRPIRFDNLLKGHFGACEDANSLRVMALRSIGIPAVMIETPNWGNHNDSHYDLKILSPVYDTTKTRITNKNIKRETQHIFSASSYDEPDYSMVPEYARVSYVRTVPKLYQRMFSKQQNSLASIKGPGDDIPLYFRNPRLKDVTSKYVEATDVTIRLRPVSGEKFAYLCVFDNQQWKPVAWSAVHHNRASFKSMGKNILYLPTYYSAGEYYAAAPPFLLNNEGKVQQIQTDKSEKQAIVAYAKYPVRTYVLRWLSYMIGGRFQLANKEDLSDSVTVHRVNTLPFFQQNISVKSSKKFRYLVYQFKGVPTTYISEIAFYGIDKAGKEVRLSGKKIGHAGQYPHLSDNLFNGRRDDLYKTLIDNTTHVGLDLGKGNAKKIARIVFNPHSDDNSVVEGDSYQLYYWNDNWIPLGISKAGNQNNVAFDEVPKGALLLLKNTNGGKQERPFLYRNGRQEFW